MIGQTLSTAGVRSCSGGRGPVGRLLLAAVLMASLGACMTKRSAYDVPQVPLAAGFKQQLADAPDSPAAEAAPPAPAPAATDDGSLVEWWRYLGNAELEGLINRGIANNADLRVATIRLAQAKARAEQAEAGRLPTLSSPLTVARQAPGGTVGSVPVNGNSRTAQTSIQSSLRGDFRLDVWGEQSAVAESAQLQLRRAALERDNVQRNVTASIAASYVELVALNDRLRLARETARVLADTLKAMERRLELGDATLGEVEQQRALIHGLRASIPTLEQQREEAINALAFLVGTLPGSLKVSTQGLDALAVPEVLPGLPSSLLLRRPDIRMMEARLLSADADIDVARARILPPVDLAAQAGYSSNALAQLFMPQTFFWNAVASLTASIFDGQRRENEKKYNEAVYEEMVETYIRTVYLAMREVEGALAAIRLTGRRLEAQREAAGASKRAWEINNKVYALGGVDHLALLESERTYHRYQDEYQRAQMDLFKGYVSLFSALGGGVRPAERLPGPGRRPDAGLVGRVAYGADAAPPTEAFAAEGLDIATSETLPEGYWQIELPGLYHRTAVGAAWRDWRNRYPDLMEGKILRPRLNGRIEGANNGDDAWYRLSIAKFADEAAARTFCDRLTENQERCDVVYARPDGKRLTSPVGKPASDKPAAPVAAPAPATLYALQFGLYLNPENAAVAAEVWKFRGYDVYVAEVAGADGNRWYALQSGAYVGEAPARAAAEAVRAKEEQPVEVVPASAGLDGKPQRVDLDALLAQRVVQDQPIVPEPPEAPAARTPVPDAVVVSTVAGRKTLRGKAAFSIQLAAFASRDNARVAIDYWQSRGLAVYLALLGDRDSRQWYAVRSGDFASRREASALAVQLGRKEGVNVLVVPYRPPFVLPDEVAPSAPASDSFGLAALPSEAVAEAPVVEPETPVLAAPNPVPAPAAPQPPVATAEKRPLPTARFSLQLGAFASIENAARAYAEWQLRGYEPYVCETDDVRGNPRFAVRVGEFSGKAEAQQTIRRIQKQDGARAVLVAAPLNDKGELRRIDVGPLLTNLTVDLPPPAEMNAAHE